MSTRSVLRSGPAFPTEIFREILDHLAAPLMGDDISFTPDTHEVKSEIKRVSLVCHCFLHICRPIIFREIDLSLKSSSDEERLRNLSQFLNAQPYLIRHIHRITGSFDMSVALPNLDSALTSTLLELPSISHLQITIVQQKLGIRRRLLTQDDNFFTDAPGFGLESLFNSYAYGYSRLHTLVLESWNAVPLGTILLLSTTRRLVLRDCRILVDVDLPSKQALASGFKLKEFQAFSTDNLPIYTLTSCRELERLLVADDTSSFDILDLFGQAVHVPRYFDNLLEASFCSQRIVWSHHCKHAEIRMMSLFPVLKKMTLSIGNGGMSEVREGSIILRHAPKLTHLCFIGDVMALKNLSQYDADSFKNVTSLELSWELSYTPSHGLEHATKILYALHIPKLEELNLNIHFSQGEYKPETIHLDHTIPLFKLYHKLPEKYQQLKRCKIRVNLDVKFTQMEDMSLAYCQAVFKERMMKLGSAYTEMGAIGELDYDFDVEAVNTACDTINK